MATVMAIAGGDLAFINMASMKSWEECVPARNPDVEDDDPPTVLLTHEDQVEVLAFLGARPVHAVIMSGLIHDNGLESSHNRGTFYGVRAPQGELEGVALIGQVTMFESRTKGALRSIARQTCMSSEIKLIFVEDGLAGAFWGYFASGEQSSPPRFRRELMYELRRNEAPHETPQARLRSATPDDLELIVKAHADMATSEHGDNPLVADSQGFRQRCLRRVEMGRVWVWIDRDKLIFKADVAAATPEALYLEGIYVDPRERGRGIGYRCLSQLSKAFLSRAGSVCLLVDEQNHQARRLYEKCGFQNRGHYQSIFLP